MELFGTAGVRGPVTEVTPELALSVGRAIGRMAADGGETPAVVIARDGRETGETLAAAVEAGVTSGGANAMRAGQLPTPTLAYASRGRYGVMVTASHNPPSDNGLKLFVDGREFDQEAEADIERLVGENAPARAWNEWGDRKRIDPLDAYRDDVVSFARQHGADAAGLSVAVDCGTGMAGVATPRVLRRLGADVTSLNANVDGHFPARESKPTAETLTTLRTVVAEGDADIGIGHDGDVDRTVVVDADGEVVHEDTIVAILAGHYTQASEADDPVVVTTPNASARIDECVRDAGGRVERVRLGGLHEGIATVRQSGGPETAVVFAAEPWKHTHTDFGPWIDGVVSAAVLTRLVAASGLDRLCDPITERPYRKESVHCPDDRKERVMAELEESLPATYPEAAVSTEYGVRLELPDGSWTLVRPSGTEPYVRVYAESKSVDALVSAVVERVEAAIGGVEAAD